jgi:hypothetical protein
MAIPRAASAEPPIPQLDAVFPPGAAAGSAVELALGGSNLGGLREVQTSIPGARVAVSGAGQARLMIPAGTVPGQYDLWALSEHGITTPRTFTVSRRTEVLEKEQNDSLGAAQAVALDSVTNGRLDKPGDVDYYRFRAVRGQRVIIECAAERIDSRLRAIPELFDSSGRRLATNRGYFGTDPLIDFRVPSDGDYVVRVQDLTGSGSPEHYYRLEIDTRPRVLFTSPGVVPEGKAARFTVFGWNLPRSPQGTGRTKQSSTPAFPSRNPSAPGLDQIEVNIPAAAVRAGWPLPVRFQPHQTPFRGFAYYLPGSQAAVPIALTDVPVIQARADAASPALAQTVQQPCEVDGVLPSGKAAWYQFEARRGEVLYFEAFGQRIGSPVDLQISIVDAGGLRELAQYTDDDRNLGTAAIPTTHLDPEGRWVAPRDGKYLVAVRDVTGGGVEAFRRRFRLSLRREASDFELLVLPRRDTPTGLTLRRGGCETLDVVALRRRGMSEPIRIRPRGLPPGVDCPEVWLGPGVEKTTVSVTAAPGSPPLTGELVLEGSSASTGTRAALSAAVVRGGSPKGWGRLVSRMPFTIAGEATLAINADAHEPVAHHLYGALRPKHAPGGIVDVSVRIDRRGADPRAPVRLIGIGLPDTVANQTTVIPAGESLGFLSFYLPPNMPLGPHSLSVRAELTGQGADKKPETVVAYSNPIVFEVEKPRFLVAVDPNVPLRVKRGETVQIGYSAIRANGFIGKIHTELASPGVVTTVPGMRARGETFVGGAERGSLQLVVNPDAPLGRIPFLRLYSVGTLEDEPIYQGACFLPLEVVE